MNKLFLCALTVSAAVGVASADVVNFESDSTGFPGNGFQSADSTQVTFTDSIGANLDLQNYGSQGDGISLAVDGDDHSALLMNFTSSQTSLSLDFGNDDPAYSSAGDLAVLNLYQGASLVAHVTVVMNRDDIMNQTISATFAGGFDNAEFFYGDSSGNPINLIEIVDHITFTPTPGAAALLGIGALAGSRRRRA